jgi:hypothetical protein
MSKLVLTNSNVVLGGTDISDVRRFYYTEHLGE